MEALGGGMVWAEGRRRGGGEGAGDCGCGLLGRQPVERQRPQLAAVGRGGRFCFKISFIVNS